MKTRLKLLNQMTFYFVRAYVQTCNLSNNIQGMSLSWRRLTVKEGSFILGTVQTVFYVPNLLFQILCGPLLLT